jgi:hypothetical protein
VSSQSRRRRLRLQRKCKSACRLSLSDAREIIQVQSRAIAAAKVSGPRVSGVSSKRVKQAGPGLLGPNTYEPLSVDLARGTASLGDMIPAVTRAQQQIGIGPVTDALVALARAIAAVAAASNPGVFYELVYQPNASGTLAPNVFTDLQMLAAAAREIAGQKLVTFDPAFLPPGAPMPIPAGVYDFRSASGAGGAGADTVWRADPARFTVVPDVQLADGVTLLGVGTFRSVRVTSHNTTTPVITATADTTSWNVEGYSALKAMGSQPFLDDGVTGHITTLEVHDQSEIDTGSAPFLRMSGAAQTLTVIADDQALVTQDTIAGVAGNSYGARISQASALIERLQAGLPGGAIAIAIGDNDLYVQHNVTTPAEAAAWGAPAPTTVEDAVRRIAIALATATGMPIPP